MIVLRIILIDCLSLIEFERVTQLIYIPLLPPIFSINEHLQRFIDVKLSGSKESKLRRISSLQVRLGCTKVASSVRSTKPLSCTSWRNLSSLDCWSILRLPRCLLSESGRELEYPGAWSGYLLVVWVRCLHLIRCCFSPQLRKGFLTVMISVSWIPSKDIPQLSLL